MSNVSVRETVLTALHLSAGGPLYPACGAGAVISPPPCRSTTGSSCALPPLRGLREAEERTSRSSNRERPVHQSGHGAPRRSTGRGTSTRRRGHRRVWEIAPTSSAAPGTHVGPWEGAGPMRARTRPPPPGLLPEPPCSSTGGRATMVWAEKVGVVHRDLTIYIARMASHRSWPRCRSPYTRTTAGSGGTSGSTKARRSCSGRKVYPTFSANTPGSSTAWCMLGGGRRGPAGPANWTSSAVRCSERRRQRDARPRPQLFRQGRGGVTDL